MKRISSDPNFEQMKQGVSSVIDPNEDAVRYYSLCRACAGRIEVPAVGDVTVAPETIVV